MKFKEQNKRKAITFSYDDGVTQDIPMRWIFDLITGVSWRISSH